MSAPAAALIALLVNGPVAAVVLTEPVDTVGGASLTLPGNELWACAYWVNGQEPPYWLRPTAPGGGGTHGLRMPVAVTELPWTYTARCLNAQGWGPPGGGVLDLQFTPGVP